MGNSFSLGAFDLSIPHSDLRWSRVLEQIRSRVTDQKFETWYRPIRPLELGDRVVLLEVPNPFFVDWFEEHNLPLLRAAVEAEFGVGPEIRFHVAPDYQDRFPIPAPRPAAPSATPRSARNGVPLKSHNLNPRFTFADFVVGGGSAFTFAASRAVAGDPGRVYNPLFIHGGVGLGKTHLMQAVGFEVLQRTPTARLVYVSAERFMNEMIESIQRGKTIEFRELYRRVDVLLVDDIQFMSGKESTQEEFFHTFNSLYDANKQVVVTCDRPPKDLQDLEERLVSRFNWGLVTDVQPPDLETRAAILRHKAEREGVELSDEVIFFVAENVRSNIRELEGSLVRLSALASLTGSPIHIDLAREVLADYIRHQAPSQPDVLFIQKVVASHFDLPVESLRGRRRTSSVALARQVGMYLAKQLTTLTLVDIGRRFGNRDHSTVLHGCGKVATRIEADAEFKQRVEGMKLDLLDPTHQRRANGNREIV